MGLLVSKVPAAQLILNRLTTEVSRYGMQFALSNCNMLLQDHREPAPVSQLGNERLKVDERFVYLGGCISGNGGAREEISMNVSRARLTFSNRMHL